MAEDGESAALAGIDISPDVSVYAWASARHWPGWPAAWSRRLRDRHRASAPTWTLKALVVIILAGTGSVLGAFPAGLLLGLVEAISGRVLGSTYREVVGLVLFLLVLGRGPAACSGGPDRRSRSCHAARPQRRRGARWLEPAVVGAGRLRALVPLFVTRDDLLKLLFRVCLFVTPGPELEHPGRLYRPDQPRSRGLLRHRRAG